MFIVKSYALGVVMCVITMLCWGSWANTQKLATKEWRFQLFYWDYAIGVFLLSLVLAFTMGSTGAQGQGFIRNLFECEPSSLGSAFLGGVIFNLSNILLVAALDIAGMAVAFPVGVGLALVLGVITTYYTKPEGSKLWLALGVAAIVVAIIVDAIAYKRLASAGQKTPLKGIIFSIVGGLLIGLMLPLMAYFAFSHRNLVWLTLCCGVFVGALWLLASAYELLARAGQKTLAKGVVLSVAAGVLMGFFYRFVVASMSGKFEVIEPGKLTPYTAVVVFSLGLLLSNFLWNTIVMRWPFVGERVPLGDYFTKGNLRLHLIGILGGIIWNVGMSFNIIASGATAPALAYGLGQGATMIAAIWGVFIWKEFKTAPPGTNKLLAAMFAFYVLGLGILIASKL